MMPMFESLRTRTLASWKTIELRPIDEATLIPKSGSHGTYMNGEARMGILTPDGFVTLLPRLGNVLDGRFTPGADQ